MNSYVLHSRWDSWGGGRSFIQNIKVGAALRHRLQVDPHGPVLEVVGIIPTEDIFALHRNVAVPAQGLNHELHAVLQHHRPGVLNILLDYLRQDGIIS